MPSKAEMWMQQVKEAVNGQPMLDIGDLRIQVEEDGIIKIFHKSVPGFGIMLTKKEFDRIAVWMEEQYREIG